MAQPGSEVRVDTAVLGTEVPNGVQGRIPGWDLGAPHIYKQFAAACQLLFYAGLLTSPNPMTQHGRGRVGTCPPVCPPVATLLIHSLSFPTFSLTPAMPELFHAPSKCREIGYIQQHTCAGVDEPLISASCVELTQLRNQFVLFGCTFYVVMSKLRSPTRHQNRVSDQVLSRSATQVVDQKV